MKLILRGHNYRYAAEQVLLAMFPDERPEYADGAPVEGDAAVISLSRGGRLATASCRLSRGGEIFRGIARVQEGRLKERLEADRLLQRAVKLAFYRAATRCAGGKSPVWGAMTGIRPGRIMTGYLERGMSRRAAVSRLCREYCVTRERAELCADTAEAGLEVKRSLLTEDICLYVGIPFCPTRCSYCSFVSQSVEKSMKLVPAYLDALLQEIDAAARAVARSGLRVISVYIGGGTPTTLDAPQLAVLMGRLGERFDLKAVREFTVEAGRPDTISGDKLAVLRDGGATRLSVNPQTMRDEVLNAIGRRHSAKDVRDAIELTRKLGGFAVNMDLIAGLPTDNPEGFAYTVGEVLEMRPENITVHTLSVKRSSQIRNDATPLPPAAEVSAMLEHCGARLRERQYSPYYLYRQKFMSGGFENLGWSLDGFQSIYNVCIMEEYRTILSLGAGASTKLVWPETGRIERIFNPKYPKEYIERIDIIRQRKEEILPCPTNWPTSTPG